jgi:hypothetical protein
MSALSACLSEADSVLCPVAGARGSLKTTPKLGDRAHLIALLATAANTRYRGIVIGVLIAGGGTDFSSGIFW